MFGNPFDDPLFCEMYQREVEREEALSRGEVVRDDREILLTGLPQESGARRVVKSQEFSLMLIDDNVEYCEKRGVLQIVKDKNTATEETVEIKKTDAIDYYSRGKHVGEDRVLSVVPLPPSRGDPAVQGQMKLAIDVALTLPHVKITDKVIVIGSAGCTQSSGQSYELLAGQVDRVDLYDPDEPEDYCEVLEGTSFYHHKELWPEDKPVESDVVFNDAYDRDKAKAVELGVSARVYSLKDVGQGVGRRLRHRYPDGINYSHMTATRRKPWNWV